jgi:hypothetical protein
MRRLLLLWFVSSAAAWSAEPSDLDFVAASSLPTELVEYLRSSQGHRSYALSSELNPYYLHADFNGDGIRDVAVLVGEIATGKRGILILHVGIGEHFVIGAGSTTGSGGDDFAWMDAWKVRPIGPVGQSAYVEEEPPSLLGDALLVIKTEAASGLIYWTGRNYEWYQQAD